MNQVPDQRDLLSTGPADADPDRRREQWHARRSAMERAETKHGPGGIQRRRNWIAFKQLIAVFGVGLRITGLWRRGVRNAHDIALTRLELAFDDLPAAFDGFRILQLSDLHVDFLAEPLESALALVAGETIDLCVLTGDYRKRVSGPYAQIMPTIERLVARLPTQHGVLAILGNHDCADMAADFEKLGITVLLNESRSIRRDGAEIHLTGTDDVHYYYTDRARAALDDAPAGFKIALVHSAELADAAAAAGFRLYLAGHTHGGQVCLPGGRPIITHMSRHRGYAAGLWRHGSMTGYTSTGIGVSGLPVRFNSRGEAVIVTLRRAETD